MNRNNFSLKKLEWSANKSQIFLEFTVINNFSPNIMLMAIYND